MTYRCHSGELFYVFGTQVYWGLPSRDQYDVPMSQFALDSWTAFARTYNPTPAAAYLNARGFSNTTKALKESGSVWQPVGNSTAGQTLRLMQYPPVEEGFGIYGPQSQCVALGFPLDYYESHV